MAKVQIKSETIATFGGIFKVMELFDSQFDSMLSSVIDSTLGQRCSIIGYQFSGSDVPVPLTLL